MLQKILSRKIVLVILFVVIAVVYFGYRSIAIRTAPVQYSTEVAKKGTIVTSVSGSGNIESNSISEVNPGISGEITEVRVILGDAVEASDVLLVIKNESLAATQSRAWVTYNQAKESLEKAKLDKLQAEESLQTLRDQDANNPDSVSDLQLAVAEQKVRAAQLAIDSAESSVWSKWLEYNEAKETAAKREIKAPISGTVIALDVKVGDDVGGTSSQASQTQNSLITIADLNKFSADIILNEVDITQIKVDQPVTMTFDAVEGLISTGKVVAIESLGTVTQGVVSYTTTVSLDSPSEKIKPGMTVDASIITAKKDDVILVPNAAVKSQAGKMIIQVLEGGRPLDKVVEVGLSNEQDTEIVSGVEEGEQVITATTSNENQSGSQGSGGFQIPGLGGGMGGAVRGVSNPGPR